MPALTFEAAVVKRQNPFANLPAYSPTETYAPQILTITGTFFAAAALIVLLRCYVRITMLKVFGADDYAMVIALVCTS